MPLSPGQTTLGAIRLAAQQRADRENNNFVGTAEWNAMINSSIKELWNILVTSFEDYALSSSSFVTDGASDTYPLPADFFKLRGADWARTPGQPQSSTTLTRFNFGERNRNAVGFSVMIGYGFVVPRYHVEGNTVRLIPRPSAGMTIQLWYTPRLADLVNDSDVLDGVSGWEELVIVDAAMKALVKEGSDIGALAMAKSAKLREIEAAAANRDAGSPATVTDVYAGGGYGMGVIAGNGGGWW